MKVFRYNPDKKIFEILIADNDNVIGAAISKYIGQESWLCFEIELTDQSAPVPETEALVTQLSGMKSLSTGKAKTIYYDKSTPENRALVLVPKLVLVTYSDSNNTDFFLDDGLFGLNIQSWSKTYSIIIKKDTGDLTIATFADFKQRKNSQVFFTRLHLQKTKTQDTGDNSRLHRDEVDYKVQGEINSWLSQNCKTRKYHLFTQLIFETKDSGICAKAKMLLEQVHENSLSNQPTQWHNDPEQFLPYVDISGSLYVYIDCRHIQNYNKLVKKDQEVFFHKFGNCDLPLSFNVAKGIVYIALKYHELCTYVHLENIDSLEKIYESPDLVLDPDYQWQAKTWFMIFCLGESARHHEWFFLGRMALELVRDKIFSMSQLINGIDRSLPFDQQRKYWPPQTQFAVRSMGSLKDFVNKHTTYVDDDWSQDQVNFDEWKYLTSCTDLIEFWLLNRYYKEYNKLPSNHDELYGWTWGERIFSTFIHDTMMSLKRL